MIQDKNIELQHIIGAKNNNRESFTFLFDKYFDIILYHLYSRFPEVRKYILEDIAIESIERWLLNINQLDINQEILGHVLCKWGREGVFKIIRRKSTPLLFSDINIDNEVDLEDRFMDKLVYHALSGLDYNEDIAKMQFKLKITLDKHIELISDRDYKVIDSFLRGDNKSEFENKTGVNKANKSSSIKRAFKHLSQSVNNKLNFKFNNDREMYLSSNVKFSNPEIMKMRYMDRISVDNISKILNKDISLIKSCIKNDLHKLNHNGKSYYLKNKKQTKFDLDKIRYNNSIVEFLHPEIMSLRFKDNKSIKDISEIQKISIPSVERRIRAGKKLMYHTF